MQARTGTQAPEPVGHHPQPGAFSSLMVSMRDSHLGSACQLAAVARSHQSRNKCTTRARGSRQLRIPPHPSLSRGPI